MANGDLELDKENTQSLQQSIHQTLGSQNASEPPKSHISIGTKFVIPQLLPPRNTNQPASAEQLEHNRAAAAHNEQLLNAIRVKQSEARDQPGSTENITMRQLIIPNLLTASGETLEDTHLQIPLNKLLKQSNSLDLTPVIKGVISLNITADEAGEITKLKTTKENPERSQAVKTIDLTSTLIARHKDAAPREAATKLRHKQASSVVEHFDIPFISCDRPPIGLLYEKNLIRMSGDADPFPSRNMEKSSAVGSMMDATVGYPRPRKPQLKYAASPSELQNLKLCKREDYGANIKRFRFDTPSPDEIVKAALQKSLRISRT
ncbi:uncharacterized protein LOC6586206 [Drosophila mojavensis]|uniref:Uncharacterized protein n=1 Tax=Drosophila mojavensis TaxID=7230 RepID=B4L8H5_DROMO|nr:uncharacterized protein LOC6586206 [Drosophila mojavensis]EDW07950.1 uncharacterized protein Dmoj_GI14414 [Drosophila mojavensis]